ncbi:ABC transporter ATP-binding protein [Thermoflexibacter ruber]|uniref:ABC transporter ATP-binding protein n=1 Tax=Thermoflexibacter ruber TaxID=1003 RepID=UPI000B852D0D
MIKTVNVEKIYTSFDVDTVALNKVNLEIEQGEFVSIMGPSGCGKSTLLNLISLMDLPTRGEVFFMEQSTSKMSDRKRAEFRRKYIGFVFQNFNLIEELSVYENIELPLVYLRMPPSERAQRVRAVMERLDVAHKQRFFPMQLSGGHQQRVAVARAIVASPLVLFADEPTGNLDSKHGQEVMEILSELNEAGTTVVMVTHSTANAEFANRIIQLFDGHIVTGKVNQYSF